MGARSEQLPTRPKEQTPRSPSSRQPIGGSRHRSAGKKRLRGKAELRAHSANPLCTKALQRGEGNGKRDSRVELPEVGFSFVGPCGTKARIPKTQEKLTFYFSHTHAGHRCTHSDNFHCLSIACALSQYPLGTPLAEAV